MIPETNGHRVKVGSRIVPVIAWDEDGLPLIAGETRLTLAKYEAITAGVSFKVIPPAAPAAKAKR